MWGLATNIATISALGDITQTTFQARRKRHILKEMLRWHSCEVSFEAFFLLFSSQNFHLGALF